MTQLETLQNQAANLEKTEDYKKLATVYREIAKIYYKQNNKEKNEEYLQKTKEAKNKITVKETKVNILEEVELVQIVALPDSEHKLQLLENFVNKYKNYSRGYFEIAKLAYNLNFLDKSKLNYEVFLKIHDKNDKENISFIHNNLAILLENEYFKDYEKAKNSYIKAIEFNPQYANAHYNLAILLKNDYFKDYDLSKQYYEKAMELNPQEADIYINFANLLTDYFDEYDLAKKYYERAIKLNPYSSDAYYNLANLLQNDYFKEYELAKKYYERTIKLNTNDLQAYYNLAFLLQSDYFKEYELAKKYYEKAKKIK